MDIGRLGGSTLRQAGPHLGIKGLAQDGGRPPHAAAPAMNGTTMGGAAQEVPQQGKHFLLHHLGLARVELRHKFWKQKARSNKRWSDIRTNVRAED